MVKIPVMFKRDNNNRVIPELNPECEWILSKDNGLMTIKIDGICVQVAYEQGKGWTIDKRMPNGTGWYTTTQVSDPLLWKAFDAQNAKMSGIFEVYGVGIHGNPHGADGTYMIKIAPVDYTLIVARNNTKVNRGPMYSAQTLFDNIKAELEESPEIEGFVFHLENSDMDLARACKIRRKDYGLPWPSLAPVEVKV
jgi:hypothetical protein